MILLILETPETNKGTIPATVLIIHKAKGRDRMGIF